MVNMPRVSVISAGTWLHRATFLMLLWYAQSAMDVAGGNSLGLGSEVGRPGSRYSTVYEYGPGSRPPGSLCMKHDCRARASGWIRGDNECDRPQFLSKMIYHNYFTYLIITPYYTARNDIGVATDHKLVYTYRKIGLWQRFLHWSFSGSP